MSTPEDRALDARKERVLRAVVERYVTAAQPVGSSTVAADGDLGVSTATIRNDMTVLERDGYLRQPHTSAGRVPTDQGYRYFVDHLAEPGLAASDRRTVNDFFASTHRAVEDLLHETSQLLAKVTDHAAVVVGPPADAATVRTVQLVLLHPRVVLGVVVLSDGQVQKVTLDRDADLREDAVAAAAAALGALLSGAALGHLPEARSSGDKAVDALVIDALDALKRGVHTSEPVFVGGAARLAAESDAFATTEAVSQLLELLEEQFVVVSMVRALLDDGVTVRIGSENELIELRDCSIVIAPYRVEGELAGTVGVLGPTRMDYRRALAAVDTVSQQLNRMLSS